METGNRLSQDVNAVEGEEHDASSVAGPHADELDSADVDEAEDLAQADVHADELEDLASEDVNAEEAEDHAAADSNSPEAEEVKAAHGTLFTGPLPRHSLFAVLMPAKAPEPKNARVIRLFDYEAAKNDPRPTIEAAPPQPKPEPKTRDREAVKAARNQSLFAAAGFVEKL